MNRGKLVAIAIRSKPHAPMVELDQAHVTTERGITGDFRGKPGPRQVTVLSADAWKTVCSELGQQLRWTTRRANLFVEGLRFVGTEGLILHVGSVALKITGETEPCMRMEEQVRGLCEALTPEWRCHLPGHLGWVHRAGRGRDPRGPVGSYN